MSGEGKKNARQPSMADEYRLLSDGELQDKLSDLREEIGRLAFRSASEEIKDTSQVGQRRRDIARILTVLNERKRKSKVEAGRG